MNVLSDYKRKVLGLAEKSIGLTVAFIGFTFPLILVDAYMGLGPDSLLILGAMGAATFLLIYAVVLYFLNASFLKKDVYSLSEKEAAVYRCNHKLKPQKSTYFCKKDKKVSDTGREGGGEDRVSR